MGWVFFDYRAGGGIRHNGDFVTSAYVEKAIAEHPLVDDVFVYGVEAASGVPGEKDVVAAVVLCCADVSQAIGVIFGHCRAVLENNSVPSFIQVMDAIPKTVSEKPQERFCLERFHEDADAVYTEHALA